MNFSERDIFEGETFADLDLQNAKITDKEFYRCTFSRCKLGKSSWPKSIFEGCSFNDCDLAQLDLADMRLRGVTFEKCRLMGLDWTKVARNPEVTFVDCNLRYSSFVRVNLRKSEFTRCALIETAFISADLAEAVFADCDFSGATFNDCNLAKADAATSRMLFVDPQKNAVKGLQVPVETAVALAAIAGMKVLGYEASPHESTTRSPQCARTTGRFDNSSAG